MMTISCPAAGPPFLPFLPNMKPPLLLLSCVPSSLQCQACDAGMGWGVATMCWQKNRRWHYLAFPDTLCVMCHTAENREDAASEVPAHLLFLLFLVRHLSLHPKAASECNRKRGLCRATLTFAACPRPACRVTREHGGQTGNASLTRRWGRDAICKAPTQLHYI